MKRWWLFSRPGVSSVPLLVAWPSGPRKASATPGLAGLGDHVLDDLRSRGGEVSNYSGNLSHEYAGVIGITRLECIQNSLEARLRSPSPSLARAHATWQQSRCLGCERQIRIRRVTLPGHIDRPRLHCGIAVGTDDRLAKSFGRFGLFARDESRPDQNAVRAEHKCGLRGGRSQRLSGLVHARARGRRLFFEKHSPDTVLVAAGGVGDGRGLASLRRRRYRPAH